MQRPLIIQFGMEIVWNDILTKDTRICKELNTYFREDFLKDDQGLKCKKPNALADRFC